jgi:hypothetical protein
MNLKLFFFRINYQLPLRKKASEKILVSYSNPSFKFLFLKATLLIFAL